MVLVDGTDSRFYISKVSRFMQLPIPIPKETWQLSSKPESTCWKGLSQRGQGSCFMFNPFLKKREPPNPHNVFFCLMILFLKQFYRRLPRDPFWLDFFQLKWIGYECKVIKSSNSCLVNLGTFRQESLLAFIYEASGIQASWEALPGEFFKFANLPYRYDDGRKWVYPTYVFLEFLVMFLIGGRVEFPLRWWHNVFSCSSWSSSTLKIWTLFLWGCISNLSEQKIHFSP